MSPGLSDLFHRHAAATFAKQMCLQELVGQRDWQFQVRPGTLSFGAGLAWKVQLLGTRSAVSNTWLWAWANTASNLPPELLVDSLALKETGQRLAIPELVEAEWDM